MLILQLKKYRLQSLEFASNCGMTVHLSLTPHLCGSGPSLSRHPRPDFATTFGTFPPKTGSFERQLGRDMCNFLSPPQQQQRTMVPYTQSTGALPAQPNPEHALAASKQSSHRAAHFPPVFPLKIHSEAAPAAA